VSQLTIPITKQDHTEGVTSALVTLVEYGDYECPFCGEAYHVIKRVQEDIGDDLRFVFRNFPLSKIHPHAVWAARGAEAATAQGRFWEMHDVLFENQDALAEEDLVSYAYLLKLDVTKFVSDIHAEQVWQKVDDDFWGGVRSGVNGTPTFFINGRRHEGLYSYYELRTAIERVARKGRVP
jgi:protein-disulfide isomerase